MNSFRNHFKKQHAKTRQYDNDERKELEKDGYNLEFSGSYDSESDNERANELMKKLNHEGIEYYKFEPMASSIEAFEIWVKRTETKKQVDDILE